METRKKVLQPKPGCYKRSSNRGRPREQFSAAAKSSFLSNLNAAALESNPSHSLTKQWFSSSCGHNKHVRYLSCQRVQVSNAALNCRVCMGKGSQHECMAYSILNQLQCISKFAVEAYAVTGQFMHNGKHVQVSRHAWDVVTAPPLKLLIEVQGEQHTQKHDTRTNNADADLVDRMNRDHALAAAAVDAGFYVVWLVPGSERGRQQRWRNLIQQAVADQLQNKPPKLYE